MDKCGPAPLIALGQKEDVEHNHAEHENNGVEQRAASDC